MGCALIFAGQAAQFVGMGRILAEANNKAKLRLEEANEVLGFDLARLMFDGPEDALTQTSVTQPAVYVHSIMVMESRADELPAFVAVAGHSLGEITALVAAGVIDFRQGLELVKVRSRAMQEACDLRPGTMAAVLGIEDDERIASICAEVNGIVIPANFNCPGQVVISGEREAVLEAAERCKAAGAKRAMEIAVGGAFHSPLMSPAYEIFKEAVNRIHFNDARVDVYQNVNATASRDALEIKNNLILQLTSSVLWTQTIRNMSEAGVNQYIEIGGKGRILAGMVKKINKDAEVNVWTES